MGCISAKQLDSVWQKWCEFRIAVGGFCGNTADQPCSAASEKQLVRNLLSQAKNSTEQAVWLRSLVELCGLTIRQVSGFFKIEPQVIVQAISLLALPAGADSRQEMPKSKRRWKAA